MSASESDSGGRPLGQQLDFFGPLSVAPATASPETMAGPAAGMTDRLPVGAATAAATGRRIRLGTRWLSYHLVRARRRSIGLLIDEQGLTVRAPARASVADIERVLHDKSSWIARKLLEAQQRLQRQQAAQLVWADGLMLAYLGGALQVRLGPGPLAAPVRIFRQGRDRIGVRLQSQTLQPEQAGLAGAGQGCASAVGAVDAANSNAILWVGLPADAPGSDLRALVTAWLQQQAHSLFEQRLNLYASPLGVRWSRLSLSNARTRWGSASSSGQIRLNWRLLQLPLPVIDYVVAHELSHLRVMDHSPRFWQTVATVMPDYAARRAELKKVVLPEWR
jgi:predicted metal-dependent hydrolase